jgi:Cu/Ag efflux pump CusA
VGGIFFSTALTLFVVPVAYTLLDRLRVREEQDLKALEPLEAK